MHSSAMSLDILRRAELGELKNASVKNQINRDLGRQRGDIPTVDDLLEAYYGQPTKQKHSDVRQKAATNSINSKVEVGDIDLDAKSSERSGRKSDTRKEKTSKQKTDAEHSKSDRHAVKDSSPTVKSDRQTTDKHKVDDTLELSHRSKADEKDAKRGQKDSARESSSNKNIEEKENSKLSKGSKGNLNASKEEKETSKDKSGTSSGKSGKKAEEISEEAEEEESEVEKKSVKQKDDTSKEKSEEEEEAEEEGEEENEIYDNSKTVETRKIVIALSHAKGLVFKAKNEEAAEKKNAYVVFKLPGDIQVKSNKAKSYNPIWSKQFNSDCYYDSSETATNMAKAYVFEDEHGIGAYEKSIGVFLFDLNDLNADMGQWKTFGGTLIKEDAMQGLEEHDNLGKIYFCATMLKEGQQPPKSKPKQLEDAEKAITKRPNITGNLMVKVFYAVGLTPGLDRVTKGKGLPTTYYQIVMPDGQDFSSKACNNTTDPVWEEAFSLRSFSIQGRNNKPLKIRLYDVLDGGAKKQDAKQGGQNNDHLIAFCDISMEEAFMAPNQCKINDLYNMRPYGDFRSNFACQVYVQCKYIPGVVGTMDEKESEQALKIKQTQILSKINKRGMLYIKLLAFKLPDIDKRFDPVIEVDFPHRDEESMRTTRSKLYKNTSAAICDESLMVSNLMLEGYREAS